MLLLVFFTLVGDIRGCTCLKCTNQVNDTFYSVGLFGWCTSWSVGALETSAPPTSAPYFFLLQKYTKNWRKRNFCAC